jgi:Glyoxalase-like domain
LSYLSWLRHLGRLAARHRLPEAELGNGADCIIDPDGGRPRIWFQVVPEAKRVKNRLYVYVHVDVSGGRTIPIATQIRRVDAEARRLSDLGATNARRLERGGHRSLRGSDEGPREPRVRHQLTGATPAVISAPNGLAKTLSLPEAAKDLDQQVLTISPAQEAARLRIDREPCAAQPSAVALCGHTFGEGHLAGDEA